MARIELGVAGAALLLAAVASMPAFGQSAAAQAKAPELASLAGTAWTFNDDNGATFTVNFEPKGGIGGTMFSPSWRWGQDGNNVNLEYANRLGGHTKRDGQLLSKTEMAGSGRSSRGASWSWTAQRIR